MSCAAFKQVGGAAGSPAARGRPSLPERRNTLCRQFRGMHVCVYV